MRKNRVKMGHFGAEEKPDGPDSVDFLPAANQSNQSGTTLSLILNPLKFPNFTIWDFNIFLYSFIQIRFARVYSTYSLMRVGLERTLTLSDIRHVWHVWIENFLQILALSLYW